jgi:hypothetical protein
MDELSIKYLFVYYTISRVPKSCRIRIMFDAMNQLNEKFSSNNFPFRFQKNLEKPQ